MAPRTISTLLVAAALGALLAAGCTSHDTLRETFREERDRCVGQVFMDPATAWCGWSDAIVMRETNATTLEYEIAPDYMGRCRWIYVVDRSSARVLSWRYGSGTKDCYDRIDWLGAW
jgi:hypothetical protein